MSAFLHDMSNKLAIIQGKIRQADKLIKSFEDKENTSLVQMKLDVALKEMEVMADLIRAEKIAEQNRK